MGCCKDLKNSYREQGFMKFESLSVDGTRITMTMSPHITWKEARTNFYNFLRACSYVIPHDDDDVELACSEFKTEDWPDGTNM